MKNITISDTIKNKIPGTRLGVIVADVTYQKHNPDLTEQIKREQEHLQDMPLEEIKNIPAIATTRSAYRALGKEPARYRPSAEALLRRLVQGKGLYQISNIVDTINLASITTGYSIGGYDYDKIQGDIVFDTGKASDVYEAIGRGIINIENLPVFRDKLGAFGSPTTDSVRTMITSSTSKVMLIVVNFGVKENFDQDLDKIASLVRNYCNGQNIEIEIVS